MKARARRLSTAAFVLVAFCAARSVAQAPSAQDPSAAAAPSASASVSSTAPSAQATAPAPAPAAASAKAAEPAAEDKLVELHGYVQPQFAVRYRPEALPRDRWDPSGMGTRAGIVVTGKLAPAWSYVVHFSLDLAALSLITGAQAVDRNGDGVADDVATTRRSAAGTIVEEITIAYSPAPFFALKLGAMRMPFTVALSSSNTSQMFATRPAVNEVFQSGSDQGLLASTQWLDERITGSLGVFAGSSLNLGPVDTTSRGLVYVARVDGAPLGKLPAAGVDFSRGPFRFGLGVGAMLRDGTWFSPTGYEVADFRETRLTASVRAAFFGGFLQAEAMRRLAQDNVTSRPNQATGAYVQASYYVPFSPSVGLAPVGRLGTTNEDEATLPRRSVYYEAGLALYPRADQPRPEGLRVLVQYQGERRVTDDESAHGVVAQAQLLF